MVGLPFRYRNDIEIRYQTGNPMGAYSSWASFALAHHYIVWYACDKLGINWYTAPYVLLGDDISFGDERLYREYRAILRTLGVEVSEAKTHESETLCEFAKRLYYKGEEITPFPFRGLKACKTDIFQLTNLFSQESRRGYPFGGTSPLRARSYQEYIFRLRKQYNKLSLCRNSVLLATSFLTLIEYQTSRVEGAKALSTIRQAMNLPDREIPDFDSRRFLGFCYLSILMGNSSHFGELDKDSVETKSKRIEWRPPEDGRKTWKDYYPIAELSLYFDKSRDHLRKVLSSDMTNLFIPVKGAPIPQMVVKHLGVPAPFSAFSVRETHKVVVGTGRAVRKVIS